MRKFMTISLVVCGALTNGAKSVSAGEIRWQSGTAETQFLAPSEAAQAMSALAPAMVETLPRHVIVQFDAPLDAGERAELAAAGVKLLDYLGDHAFYAAISGAAFDAQRVAGVGKLRLAMDVQPAWKLHATLARGEIVPWSIVDGSTAVLEAYPELRSEMIVPAPGEDPTVAAYVLFHPDVGLADVGIAMAQNHGAHIVALLESINGLVVEMPYREISELATEDAVMYIEPPLPQFSVDNSSNRTRTGADVAQAAPYNLDGAGVTVLVYDGGSALASHADFGGRLFTRDSTGLSDHATHVSGTIGGDGSQSAGANRGMAPGVTIQSYGFETGGPLEAGFLYTNPGDLESDYNQAINVYGADISNNSIGTNVAPNGFPCDWEGNYNVTSALIDAIVRGSLGAPFRIVWAGGNERGNGRCGTTYNTIAPPAGAKNHLSIGALNSNDDSVTSFTGWGPTDDGRMKPDFAAPGCQSNDDGGVTSCSSSGGYSVKCGTSMASPTVCGISSLLLQDYRANYPGEPDFRNSTLKAVLAQTALDIENPGPDYRSGYGSVRIVPAIDLMRAGNFLESELVHGQTMQFLIVVAPGDPQLKVTLAWDDVPGTPAVDPVLVNDLDLRVIDAGSNAFYPWTLDPLNPSVNAVRVQADHVNNLEQVVIDAPAPGAYLVQVAGYNVPQGPQSFSLAAGPLLINCSPQGVLRYEQDSYACQSTLTISVNDCDVNTNDFAVETVDITIASDTEPGGEVITLVETGPQTAFFVGTIALDTVDSTGVLQVSEGDTVTATYIDADDGFGNLNVPVVETVGVDCTAPVVSNVNAVDIDPRSARITFDTNEPATGTVFYGTDCANLADEAGAFGSNTSHNISLSQLQDDTLYYYGVEAVDPADNTTFDTNGGACYTFTTPEIPDYFTQDFVGDFDLENRAILFAPNGSVDYYSACSYETLVLPTDPAGGNTVFMGDTSSFQVNLTGAQVLVYGQSYNSFYINANGNVTFTASDNDTTESFSDHFDMPRISVLFDDLDPSEGGTVSWKQLADRAVVTWEDVPEDSGNNDNTFQVEMYYDGRIQISWLNIDATDGLAGLSAGGGVPIDFFESDLSGLGTCGPRAPSAAGRTVVTGQDRPVTFSLLASDDGLPNPPGVLNYIVTALPTYELRDAGDGHLIVSGDLPYVLVGGGNTLTYTPGTGFLGNESFAFKASDGGVPPDAGDSNVATVVIQVDPVLTVPFFDPFSDQTYDPARWSLVANATIDDGGIDEPSAPYSARFNGTPSGGDEIRTHLMDLTGLSDVRLVYYFERTGTGESPDSGENLHVDYLDSNGIWNQLRQYAGDGDDMTAYVREDLLLPAEALHDSFRLRFRNSGTASSSNIDDWFVDDVSLTIGDAPFAYSLDVTVRQDDPTDITLLGSDPNSDPLEFIITTLPAGGVLMDPNGGLIDSTGLPYTLASSGDVVRYQRTGGFLGTDAFSFKVTDGAYDSFVATARVEVLRLLDIPFEDTFPDFVFDPSIWFVVDGATIDGEASNMPSPPLALRLNGQTGSGDQVATYPLDLAGYADIRLRYYWERTGNGSSPEAGDDLFVEYLDSNGSWQVLAQYLGDGPDMTDFTMEDGPLPTGALHGNFQLRFRTAASSSSVDDWFVDNILIYHPDAPMAGDLTVQVPQFGWAEIELPTTDPNGDSLDHIILSVPTQGGLYDMSDGTLITAGALPFTLNAGNQVRYLPTLGFVGSDSFAYRANDGALNSNIATVSVEIGGEQPVWSFPLDVDPGWSTEGLWAFGPPQGVDFDPASGATGANVYGYNLAGKYESSLPPTYLTTTALDLSNVVDAELRFHRWLGVESNFFDQAALEISSNGTSWSTIWEHTEVAGIFDRAWVPQVFDISAVADQQATVYLRWSMGPTDGSGEFEGWNIDDIEIFGEVLAGPGDIDQDGDVDDADLRAFVACLSGPSTTPTPSAPMTATDCMIAFDFDLDGDVDLVDFGEFASYYTGAN